MARIKMRKARKPEAAGQAEEKPAVEVVTVNVREAMEPGTSTPEPSRRGRPSRHLSSLIHDMARSRSPGPGDLLTSQRPAGLNEPDMTVVARRALEMAANPNAAWTQLLAQVRAVRDDANARIITVDPAQPGSDRTVMGIPVVVDPRMTADTFLARPAQQSPEDPRIARLLTQFFEKSRQALRGEGANLDITSRHRMDPDVSDLRRVLRLDGAARYIQNILGVLYWGYGDRRICMMECEMDRHSNHRGVDTNLALAAFNLRNPRNFGIQPFGGSQQYNETVGFFIYNAQRGGSL